MYSQSNDLRQEGASEPGLDQQRVAHGTLIETLANYLASEMKVLQFQFFRSLMVGMHLQQTQKQQVLIVNRD